MLSNQHVFVSKRRFEKPRKRLSVLQSRGGTENWKQKKTKNPERRKKHVLYKTSKKIFFSDPGIALHLQTKNHGRMMILREVC